MFYFINGMSCDNPILCLQNKAAFLCDTIIIRFDDVGLWNGTAIIASKLNNCVVLSIFRACAVSGINHHNLIGNHIVVKQLLNKSELLKIWGKGLVRSDANKPAVMNVKRLSAFIVNDWGYCVAWENNLSVILS